MTTTKSKLSVWAPRTPGAQMGIVGQANSIAEAREIASRYSRRPDLRYCDVEIRLGTNGKRVEFAGPAR